MVSPRSRSARLAAALIALCSTAVLAATVAPPTNGPKRVDPRWHALTGADVVVRPGRVIQNATLIIRDGVVQSVEARGPVPLGARVHDLAGLRIYPGFIEPYAEVDAPAPSKDAPGAHWRENVTPQRSALDAGGLTSDQRQAMRKLGFSAAAIAPKAGLFRGTGALVSLAEPADDTAAESPRVLRDRVFHAVAPETGGWGGTPPTSLMGAIAIIRQTLSDAAWYDAAKTIEATRTQGIEPLAPNHALAALGPNNPSGEPLLFDAANSLNALRFAKVASEFNRRAILLGSGEEYERAQPIADLGLPLIVPVVYPEAPDVSSLAASEAVSLQDLMAWEQAPTNLRRLHTSGAAVAVTTHRLKKTADFWPNLRSAVKHGLDPDDALSMLTTQPASILGAADQLGSIEPGKLAFFTIYDGDPFTNNKAELREVWSAGTRYEITPAPENDADGTWDLRIADAPSATLEIKDTAKAVTVKTEDDTTIKARSIERSGDRLTFLLDAEPLGLTGTSRMSAVLRGNTMQGQGVDAQGNLFAWSANRQPATEDKADNAADEDDADDDDPAADVPDALPIPFGAYGRFEPPAPETLLITGATLWTSADAGVIEDGALIIRDGSIVYAGPAARTPRLAVNRTIDADGKHITPGLFDAHSHMGISGGVNEGGEAVTAEVRIADVINPDDIAWYRALAGGLTTANQLHGSANPIGGQNTVVKLRWGAHNPDDLLLDAAPGGIKFALGENVKRSGNRYPDTRMGVETLIRDRFIAAAEYTKARDAYNALSDRQKQRTLPPRHDLELDALAEILAGDRLVHCHSYRQDEILMLCRVAEDFGFTIGTFQHVLEGYKVADEIAKHSLGGSSFSDWWAYKFEVFDAIPHNGALMHEVGVTVSFNSDDNELARRMNTEAAKAVRYGNVDPHEALKFVTLNPAKQFKVEDRIGSLEPGKDADFVIWSGSPLSTLSRCEATYIDGAEYFSLQQDAALRARDHAERQRLIQKVLAKGKKKTSTTNDDASTDEEPKNFTQLEVIGLEMLRAGMDPDKPTCGECGFMERLGLHDLHVNEGASR